MYLLSAARWQLLALCYKTLCLVQRTVRNFFATSERPPSKLKLQCTQNYCDRGRLSEVLNLPPSLFQLVICPISLPVTPDPLPHPSALVVCVNVVAR